MAGTFIKPEDTRSAMPFRLNKKSHVILPLLCLLVLLLPGCKKGKAPGKPAVQVAPAQGVRKPGCQGCHSAVRLDPSHALACTVCHGGNEAGATQEQA
ncbi:MAG: hypothetical protein ACYC2W_10165, partial [Desulfurivibrionaceae bacterium]